MDDRQVGALLRVLRIRKRLRQLDVAVKAAVPREVVVAVEAGRLTSVPVGQLRALGGVCGAWIDVRVRTPDDDGLRLMDHAHARLQEATVVRLRELGWQVVPEASFAFYGERGVIDILAWHPAWRALLVVELKTLLVDLGSLLATMDRRVRLAQQIAGERGWHPVVIGAWIGVSDTSTNRKRLAAHVEMIRSAYPQDGRRVGAWLREPRTALRAFGFLSNVAPGDHNHDRGLVRRVRLPRPAPVSHGSEP